MNRLNKETKHLFWLYLAVTLLILIVTLLALCTNNKELAGLIWIAPFTGSGIILVLIAGYFQKI